MNISKSTKKWTILLSVSSLFISQNAQAQVAKKIVVEHFTNTECSNCASRNPGFYNNYNTLSNALHITIHPSAPYSSCLLYKQNSVDNDERTNYYGIYGSTPRLVINGSAISSGSNYSSNSIFTAQQSQTTPASVSVTQSNFGTDSIKSTVIIKTEASHSLGTLALFVALVEDTVTYTGGNNEKKHFDVYRKSASQTTGLRVTLPASVGDSQIYTFYTKFNSVWNKSRIYTMAILQDSSSKSLVQAAASKVIGNQVASVKTANAAPLISVYPNPAAEFTNIAFNGTLPWNVEVYNSNGTKVYSKKVETMTTSINLSDLPPSMYVIRAFNNENTVTQKIITQ